MASPAKGQVCLLKSYMQRFRLTEPQRPSETTRVAS